MLTAVPHSQFTQTLMLFVCFDRLFLTGLALIRSHDSRKRKWGGDTRPY